MRLDQDIMDKTVCKHSMTQHTTFVVYDYKYVCLYTYLRTKCTLQSVFTSSAVTGVKTLHPTTITVEVSSTANTWGPTYGEKGNSSVEADDEVKDVVQMKCGCNIDALDYHTDYMGQWSHSNMCGGRADPELPVSA